MKRNTLAKQIEAQADTDKAIEVAIYGHLLTPIERTTTQYLYFSWEVRYCIETGPSGDYPDLKHSTEAANDCRDDLAQAMMDAVDKKDGEALRFIADLIENFEPLPVPAAKQRAHILTLKRILDERGDTMPICRLAELLHYPPTDDSYSALRRLCLKLKFPLETAKRGAPKRIQTRKRK
ncbi:MAG: hypothetical protein JWR69_2218 [Pedosphaera sp.]|nr:hypothetical protein [Pedosphaera sp.]